MRIFVKRHTFSNVFCGGSPGPHASLRASILASSRAEQAHVTSSTNGNTPADDSSVAGIVYAHGQRQLAGVHREHLAPSTCIYCDNAIAAKRVLGMALNRQNGLLPRCGGGVNEANPAERCRHKLTVTQAAASTPTLRGVRVCVCSAKPPRHMERALCAHLFSHAGARQPPAPPYCAMRAARARERPIAPTR